VYTIEVQEGRGDDEEKEQRNSSCLMDAHSNESMQRQASKHLEMFCCGHTHSVNSVWIHVSA